MLKAILNGKMNISSVFSAIKLVRFAKSLTVHGSKRQKIQGDIISGRTEDAKSRVGISLKYIVPIDRHGTLGVDWDILSREMETSIEQLRHEFSKLRLGRACSAMLEGVNVSLNRRYTNKDNPEFPSEEIQTSTPILKLGTFVNKDNQTLLLHLHNHANLKSVASAIQSSGRGLLVGTDGSRLVITIPRYVNFQIDSPIYC
jgi:hypothetical protein